MSRQRDCLLLHLGRRERLAEQRGQLPLRRGVLRKVAHHLCGQLLHLLRCLGVGQHDLQQAHHLLLRLLLDQHVAHEADGLVHHLGVIQDGVDHRLGHLLCLGVAGLGAVSATHRGGGRCPARQWHALTCSWTSSCCSVFDATSLPRWLR